MIDPLSLGIGGFLAFVGWAAGRRRGTSSKPPQPIEFICSCTHGYGTHEEQDGRCLGKIKRPVSWRLDRWDEPMPTHFEWVACPCIRYDGPEPLPRAFNFPSSVESPKADNQELD